MKARELTRQCVCLQSKLTLRRRSWKQIEVVSCDDEGTAMKAAICAKDLVNKGVKMVIGSYTSTCAEAAQATYYRAGVLQTTDGTSDTLTEKGYWTFFRNSFPIVQKLILLQNILLKKKNINELPFIPISPAMPTVWERLLKTRLKLLTATLFTEAKLNPAPRILRLLLPRLNPKILMSCFSPVISVMAA